jgi:iron complex outermembrane receptor protein
MKTTMNKKPQLALCALAVSAALSIGPQVQAQEIQEVKESKLERIQVTA